MKTVISLFDETGLAGRDWAMNGYNVHCFDIVHDEIPRVEKVGKGLMIFTHWDARNVFSSVSLMDQDDDVHFVMAFPPCTDLAVSGAAHFSKKFAKNPNFQKDAVEMVLAALFIAGVYDCPFIIENPVSVLSTMWRKPNFMFDPYEYGGYLPEDDVHPEYPEYIEPRDAYRKKTCYWTGGGFDMPEPIPVPFKTGYSKQHRLLGGKSAKTKRIRSASPRGIARAIYLKYGDTYGAPIRQGDR